jgi:hypothetical protein
LFASSYATAYPNEAQHCRTGPMLDISSPRNTTIMAICFSLARQTVKSLPVTSRISVIAKFEHSSTCRGTEMKSVQSAVAIIQQPDYIVLYT